MRTGRSHRGRRGSNGRNVVRGVRFSLEGRL